MGEERILMFQEGFRKMTSFLAQKLGLKDSGLIREGMWADISIFNYDRIMDRAMFVNPHCYPERVGYVLVNGKIVIEKGEHTKETLGKVLRRPS